MKIYNFKKDDVFLLPTKEDLIELGWNYNTRMDDINHPDSPVSIIAHMFDKLDTLVTIDQKDNYYEGCYFITKVDYNYTWPIDLLYMQMIKTLVPFGIPITQDECDTVCKEGITPILGYFICKYCGKNMRKI